MTLNELKVLEFSPPKDIASQVGAGELSAPFMLAILNASPDCIKIIELDGTLSFMNHNGLQAMEIDAFDHVANKEWHSLWPEESRGLIKQAVKTAATGETVRLKAFCPTGRGTPRWWDIFVAPVLSQTGNPVRILSVSRDITELVAQEDRLREQDLQLKAAVAKRTEILEQKDELLKKQDMLLREIDHRVKNSLSMTASILRLHARKTDDAVAREEISDAANRVMTIGKVHERLYQDQGISVIQLEEYLHSLSNDIFASIAKDNINLSVECAPCAVPADMAVSIGLLTAELMSNSLRHGFDDQGGELRIVLSRSAGKRAVLCVSDNGKGLPDDFEQHRQNGLGMKIVDIYVERIGGTLAFHNKASGGAHFEIAFETD